MDDRISACVFDLEEAAVHLQELAGKLLAHKLQFGINEDDVEILTYLAHVQEHLCLAWHGRGNGSRGDDKAHVIPNWNMQFFLSPPEY